MHECEYCGDERCIKRACIDAILATAAYYDAEAKYRVSIMEVNSARADALAKAEEALKENPVTIGRSRGTTLP